MEAWEKFGLEGLVIGALFAALGLLVKAGVSAMQRLHDSHKEERQLWIEKTAEGDEKVAGAIDRLSGEIRSIISSR